MDRFDTLMPDEVWKDDEIRLIICKELPNETPNLPFRIMSMANYILYVDVSRFKVAKNRTGSMMGLATILSDHLGTKFVVDGDYLKLANEEDLTVLKLKGIL